MADEFEQFRFVVVCLIADGNGEPHSSLPPRQVEQIGNGPVVYFLWISTMPVRHQDAYWRIPPAWHVVGNQFSGQHTDGLGGGGRASGAQFWPDKLLQGHCSWTDVP